VVAFPDWRKRPSVEFAAAQRVENFYLISTGNQFSTDTSAVVIARELMFEIVSGIDGGALLNRNARIAAANQLATIVFNGVFRVTNCLGPHLIRNMVFQRNSDGIGVHIQIIQNCDRFGRAWL
jgi:hypothetical protein